MRDNVLWRKISNIVMMLSDELRVSPEQALDTFYSTETYRQLSEPKHGLHLMSNPYIVENVLAEMRQV